MSSEAVLQLILNSLQNIQKDMGDIKEKQVKQDKLVAELQRTPKSEYNGQSVEQLIKKLNTGSYQELSMIDKNINYTVDLIFEYGKKVGI